MFQLPLTVKKQENVFSLRYEGNELLLFPFPYVCVFLKAPDKVDDNK